MCAKNEIFAFELNSRQNKVQNKKCVLILIKPMQLPLIWHIQSQNLLQVGSFLYQFFGSPVFYNYILLTFNIKEYNKGIDRYKIEYLH